MEDSILVTNKQTIQETVLDRSGLEFALARAEKLEASMKDTMSDLAQTRARLETNADSVSRLSHKDIVDDPFSAIYSSLEKRYKTQFASSTMQKVYKRRGETTDSRPVSRPRITIEDLDENDMDDESLGMKEELYEIAEQRDHLDELLQKQQDILRRISEEKQKQLVDENQSLGTLLEETGSNLLGIAEESGISKAELYEIALESQLMVPSHHKSGDPSFGTPDKKQKLAEAIISRRRMMRVVQQGEAKKKERDMLELHRELQAKEKLLKKRQRMKFQQESVRTPEEIASSKLEQHEDTISNLKEKRSWINAQIMSGKEVMTKAGGRKSQLAFRSNFGVEKAKKKEEEQHEMRERQRREAKDQARLAMERAIAEEKAKKKVAEFGKLWLAKTRSKKEKEEEFEQEEDKIEEMKKENVIKPEEITDSLLFDFLDQMLGEIVSEGAFAVASHVVPVAKAGDKMACNLVLNSIRTRAPAALIRHRLSEIREHRNAWWQMKKTLLYGHVQRIGKTQEGGHYENNQDNMVSALSTRKAEVEAEADENPCILPMVDWNEHLCSKVLEWNTNEHASPRMTLRGSERRYWKRVQMSLRHFSVGSGILVLKCDPYGKRVAVAENSGTVKIWDLVREKPICIRICKPPPSTIKQRHTKKGNSRPTFLAWSPDGFSIVCIYDNGWMNVWSLALLADDGNESILPMEVNQAPASNRSNRGDADIRSKDGSFKSPTAKCIISLDCESFKNAAETLPETDGHTPVSGAELDEVLTKSRDTTAASFHPSFTFFCSHPSFVLGNMGGEVIKVNTEAARNAVFAPPLPAERNLARHFPTSASEAEKVGLHGNVPVLERFNSHRASIRLVGFVQNSSTMITVDATGVICIWPYHMNQMGSYGWYNPSKRAKVETVDFGFEPKGEEKVILGEGRRESIQAEKDDDDNVLTSPDVFDNPILLNLCSNHGLSPHPYCTVKQNKSVRKYVLRPKHNQNAEMQSFHEVLVETSGDRNIVKHTTRQYRKVECEGRILDICLAAGGRDVVIMTYFEAVGPRKHMLSFACVDAMELEFVSPRVDLILQTSLKVGAPPKFVVTPVMAAPRSDYICLLLSNSVHILSLATGQEVRPRMAILDDSRSLQSIDILACSSTVHPILVLGSRQIGDLYTVTAETPKAPVYARKSEAKQGFVFSPRLNRVPFEQRMMPSFAPMWCFHPMESGKNEKLNRAALIYRDDDDDIDDESDWLIGRGVNAKEYIKHEVGLIVSRALKLV